ncbi:potassium channel family protein [Paenibacillus solisilvae]|uniref:Potassium channel family protein n=1 Tax=Paenibacillus solisilvae TaxID=2486751 RepID=A0ABW0VXM3_9BACL
MYFFMRLVLKAVRLRKMALGSVILIFILGSASIAYWLEPSTFQTWFNALYWVLTTMATVGYGDFFAKTVIGKLFTIFLYIFGIGLLSVVIGKIIDSVADIQRKKEAGQLKFQGKDHIIIINWSKKAQYAVEEILSYSPAPSIVLIDESDRHPLAHQDQVHFISGDPSLQDVLERAKLKEARAAIIFADARIDEPALVDGKTLLIASSIERFAPNIHTTVEITQDQHVQNFQHVKVNEFVLSHDAISRLAVRAALQQGNSEVFNQLLSRQHGDDIYEIPVKQEWKTYGDAFQDLLLRGATLISDRGDLGINRKLTTAIPSDARLYAVADEETFLSLTGKSK